MFLMDKVRASRKTRRPPFRIRAFENLERRDMLTGTLPVVTGVEVGSTSWSPAFVGFLQEINLGTTGYLLHGGRGQAVSLPWTNLDQVTIRFSEDVHVDISDLSLTGINVPVYHFSGFHYDPQLCKATWALATPIVKDRLRLDLDTDGLNPVRDVDGNLLDGEWINNVTWPSSGNGVAGGDFEYTFNVLPADVNTSGSITYYDYIYIEQNIGRSTYDDWFPFKYDIDGNGAIESVDAQAALDRIAQALPSGSPAGTFNDAPTTSGFSRVQINDAAVDVAISLLTGFRDLESGSSGLTYSILSNSNPTLFDTAQISPSSGALVLNAAYGVSGRANIKIRATDPGGLSTDTTMTVDVNRANQPPYLLATFYIAWVAPGSWLVSGDVVDPDDDVSNLLVVFSGVFSTRAAVDENGHFEFAVILDEEEMGIEFAVTHDLHGLQSNIRWCDIGLT